MRLPFDPPFDHLVYVRVFEGCNLNCQHCFVPHNPKRMTHSDIAKIPSIVGNFAKAGQVIFLDWHGGEPTLLGSAWLETSIDIIHSAPSTFIWKHGLQTNLLTYDSKWGALLHAHFGGQIGVSWDYGIRVFHGDSNSFERYDQLFWSKYKKVLDDGLKATVLITGTKIFFERFANPFEFFTMMSERGVSSIHIERITQTGAARQHWQKLGIDNATYSRHMSRFLRAYILWQKSGNNPKLVISPFDGLLQSCLRLKQGQSGAYGCWSGKCDSKFHTIDAAGYKAGCSALTSEQDNASAKAVFKINDYAADRRQRQASTCVGCSYRRICKTGCLAVPQTDESGECAGGFKLFETAMIALDTLSADQSAALSRP